MKAALVLVLAAAGWVLWTRTRWTRDSFEPVDLGGSSWTR